MRVKSLSQKKHRKFLKLARGYRMTRHKLFKVAHEAVMHAGQYAYIGRKLRKRDMRRTWITRLNAALRPLGLTYSKFIPAYNKSGLKIDRKILSDLAVRQPQVFAQIVDKVK